MMGNALTQLTNDKDTSALFPLFLSLQVVEPFLLLKRYSSRGGVVTAIANMDNRLEAQAYQNTNNINKTNPRHKETNSGIITFQMNELSLCRTQRTRTLLNQAGNTFKTNYEIVSKKNQKDFVHIV